MKTPYGGQHRTNLSRLLFTAAALSLVLRMLFVFLTPNWEAPDEFPHFYYTASAAHSGGIPEFSYRPPYYESYQPPLYYAVGAMLLKAYYGASTSESKPPEAFTDRKGIPPELIVLRLYSMLAGIAAIVIAYFIFRRGFPESGYEPRLALLLLMLHPSFLSNTTAVTNDVLAVLFGFAAIFALFSGRLNRFPETAGTLVFFGILTKANLQLFLPLGVVYYILKSGPVRVKAVTIGRFLLPSAAGFAILTAVIDPGSLQLWLSPPFTPVDEPVSAFRIYQVFRNMFWSFWTAFGRTYQVHLPGIVYAAVFLPVTAAAEWGVLKRVRSGSLNTDRTTAFALISFILYFFASSAFSILFSFNGLNTSWGKNLFPVLPLIILLFVGGLNEVCGKWTAAVVVSLAGICAAIDIWALLKLVSI